MKIDNLGNLFNKAKNYTEKLKEKYGPKLNDVIEDVVDFADENIPKCKEKAKEVFEKTKEKAKNMYDDAYQRYMASQPLKIDVLRENAQNAESVYMSKWLALEKAKMFSNDVNVIKAYEAEANIAKLNAQKATQEYQKFKEQQEIIQREFERINKF